MKKLSKFIYFIFAFALITCMAIFNPAITFASAETALDTDKVFSISTEKIASTVDAANDEKLIIPMPKVNGVDNYTSHILVKDRSGKTYTYNCADATTTNEKGDAINYFTLLNANKEVTTEVSEVAYVQVANLGKGLYTVQYKVVDTDTEKVYYSDAKSVNVKSVAYSWEFNAENQTKNIIPSITNAGTSYELPLPKIIKSNDNENPIEFEASDLGTAIKITRGGKDVSTGNGAVAKVEDGKIIFTPVLDTTAVAEGENTTYTIRYIASAKGVMAFADTTYTVKVEKDYNSKAELEVTHNAITNYQVGAITTFPTANVTDKTHNKSNVDVNVQIVIKKNGELLPEDKQPKVNQYTYTFTEAGDYTITYKVTDAYGNEATSKSKSIRVSDKKPYMVAYADSYETTGDNWEDKVNTDVAYTIKSEVGFNGFWLPAIYAKDYKDGYDVLKTNFKRIIRSTADSSIYFDLDSNDVNHGNAAYADNQAAGLSFNDRIEFRFPEGKEKDYIGMTFKLEYTAKDGNNHNTEAYATSYTFKVLGEDAQTSNADKNLKIDFPSINAAIDPTQEFTFTSAVAKEEPTDSNLIADERIEVRTYYYYGDKDLIEDAFTTHVTGGEKKFTNEKYGYIFDGEFYTSISSFDGLTKLDTKDGKVTLNLEGYNGTQDKATIFAVAINDQNQFVIKAQEVAINKTGEYDTVAPVLSSVVFEDTYQEQLDEIATGLTAFNQNYKVYLPQVKFTDDDKSLQVRVNCYVDTPDQTVGVDIDSFFAGCGIKDASVTTTYAGTYYVVYSATDDAGHTTSYISTFDVAKTEKGYIHVEEGSKITKNVGEEVVLNFDLEGEGDYTYTADDFYINWGENKPSGLGSLANSFRFDKPGTYVATIGINQYVMNGVTYTDTPSVTVTITVKEPEMKWESDVDAVLTNRTADVDDIVELPIISAIENGTPVEADVKVVFIDKNDKETEVELTLDETSFNNYFFKAEENGVYKVTYTATTAYNSMSKSFTVTCGDYYDPTVIIESNKFENSKVVYNGTDIEVSAKLTQEKDEYENNITGKYVLTVTGKEGNKEVFSYDIKVDLKDTDDKGNINLFNPKSTTFTLTGDSASSNGTNKWTITGVGNYKLTLTVKDANDNVTTKSIEFKVANKTEPKSIKDEVVGIVLIVVSVVVLGGIILFFALAGKRNKSGRKSIKRSNKD